PLVATRNRTRSAPVRDCSTPSRWYPLLLLLRAAPGCVRRGHRSRPARTGFARGPGSRCPAPDGPSRRAGRCQSKATLSLRSASLGEALTSRLSPGPRQPQPSQRQTNAAPFVVFGEPEKWERPWFGYKVTWVTSVRMTNDE